jgi:hypothetical protein
VSRGGTYNGARPRGCPDTPIGATRAVSDDFHSAGWSGRAAARRKMGMTTSQRFASWSYRTTASPLVRGSQVPVKPANSVFVGTLPYSTRPVVSNRFPFFVKMARREFTVWMM